MNKPKQIIEKKYSKISKINYFTKYKQEFLKSKGEQEREPLYTERSNKS